MKPLFTDVIDFVQVWKRLPFIRDLNTDRIITPDEGLGNPIFSGIARSRRCQYAGAGLHALVISCEIAAWGAIIRPTAFDCFCPIVSDKRHRYKITCTIRYGRYRGGGIGFHKIDFNNCLKIFQSRQLDPGQWQMVIFSYLKSRVKSVKRALLFN